jgi:hypothetical protein
MMEYIRRSFRFSLWKFPNDNNHGGWHAITMKIRRPQLILSGMGYILPLVIGLYHGVGLRLFIQGADPGPPPAMYKN